MLGRVRRRLFTLLSGLSLLLFAATCMLWVRTYYVGYDVFYFGAAHDGRALNFAARTHRGLLLIIWGSETLRSGREAAFERDRAESVPVTTAGWRVETQEAVPYSGTTALLAGLRKFEYLTYDRPASVDDLNVSRRKSTWIWFPLWLLAFLFAIGPSIRAWRSCLSRRRWKRAGLCASCGYDLRVSRDRCPECGTAVPVPSPGTPGEG
jgi:4-amino-4-deoxy-L-arabinose transferase-like glycosyltransferase